MLSFAVIVCLLSFATSSDCKNPLFDQMEPKLVPLNHPSQYHANTCGGMWKRDKVCCSFSTIEQWTKTDTQKIKNATLIFSKLTQKIADRVKSLPDGLTKAISLQNLTFLKRLQDESWNISAETQQCFEHLTAMRRSAICSICSANFKQYLVENKAAISKEDCKATIHKCASVIKESAFLISGFKNFTEKPGLKSFFAQPEFKNVKDRINNFLNSQNLKTLTKIIDRNSTESNGLLPVQICETFLTLVRPTMFNSVNNILSILDTHLTEMLQAVANARMLKLRFASPSRNLQDDSSLVQTDFVKPDTVVLLKPSDNLFTSVDGRQGTTLHQESTSQKPMNLSLIFP